MRKGMVVVVTILILSAIAVGAYTWVNALVNSIYGYRSPLKGAPPATEYIHRPLTSQVVLVIIDGLRYGTSLQMPYLNTLREEGAHGLLLSDPPSSALAAWTALVSGATPEISDAPLFDREHRWIQPIAVDHLFAALNRVGATTGIAGFHWWERLVPADNLYTRYFVNAEGAAADKQVIDRATIFLTEFRPNLLLVQLRQTEVAGRDHGGASPEYRQAALHCDEHLRQLAESMNLKHSALIVVSSYGHLDAGGNGGAEEVTLTTPFVMVGESVRAGDYGVVAQTDIAPTIAALLGTPVPSATQGNMQVDMLRMNVVDTAEKLVTLATQRVRMGNVYLGSIGRGGLSQTAEGDMLVAVSSLQVKNHSSAAELAALAVRQADQEMTQARDSRVRAERTRRTMPIAAAVTILLWIIWLNRSRLKWYSLLTALLSAGLYHALFLQQGGTYSFSRMPAGGLAATVAPSARRAAIALALGALVIAFSGWRRRERSAFAVMMLAYDYALLQLFFIGLLVAACTWWNGPLFFWYLPSFAVAYLHFASLMQALLIATMAILFPIAVAILQRGLLSISDRGTKLGVWGGSSYAGGHNG
jgi:hypothetical protein